jgi:Tol biopolymer transport system component
LPLRALTALALVAASTLAGVAAVSPAASADPIVYNGKIAFTRASGTSGVQDVMVVNPDGTAALNLTPTTHGMWPSFRGDGSELAYVDMATNQLTAVSPDGTNKHTLFAWSGGIKPRWSPDATRVAWTDDESPSNAMQTVHLSNADGTNPQTPFASDALVEADASWSGNSQLVFRTVQGTDNYVSIANADGSARSNLFHGAAGVWGPSLDANGSALVFEWFNGQENRIVLASGDGSNAHFVAPAGADAVFSPDGNRIAFSRVGANQGIWTMRLDGTDLRRVTSGPDQSPQWAPGSSAPNIAPHAYGSAKNSASRALFGNAAASFDEDGSIVGYEWRWGDNTPMTPNKYAWHKYASPGTYLVRLTVVDDDGAKTTKTAWVNVS